LQDAKDSFRVHFVHRQSTQGLGIFLERHAPLGPMLFVAPLARLRRKQFVRALAEGWLAGLDPPGFAPGRDRVDPGRYKLAGLVSLIPSLGEGCPVPAYSGLGWLTLP